MWITSKYKTIHQRNGIAHSLQSTFNGRWKEKCLDVYTYLWWRMKQQQTNWSKHMKTTPTTIFHNCIGRVRWIEGTPNGWKLNTICTQIASFSRSVGLCWFLQGIFIEFSTSYSIRFDFVLVFMLFLCYTVCPFLKAIATVDVVKRRNISKWIVSLSAIERSLHLFITRIDLKMMSTHFVAVVPFHCSIHRAFSKQSQGYWSGKYLISVNSLRCTRQIYLLFTFVG